jgi:hypothetical protein
MDSLCRLIGHRRNKRRITQWRDSWQSECIICSTRLARVRPGQWVPISAMAAIFRYCHARRTD